MNSDNCNVKEVGVTQFINGTIKLFVNPQFTSLHHSNTLNGNDKRTISGYVMLTLREKMFLHGVWIVLKAKSIIYSNSPIDNSPLFETDLLEQEEDYFSDGIYRVFVGFGPYDHLPNQQQGLVNMSKGIPDPIFHVKS